MTGSTPDVDWPRTGLVLPEYTDKSGDWLVEFAREADRAGFESVWVGESWGYDPFTLLGRVAERTACPLGTSIANVFARSPAALATGAIALDDATDGRFFLGIGASTPAVVEQFYGESFDRPLRRLREAIEIVDLAVSGEPVDYDGEVFDLEGFTLNHAGDASIPILNAALNTGNVALTIDHADGMNPHMMPISGIGDALEKGRERAHTDRDVHVSPVLPTAVSEDEDAARRALSKHFAFYLGSTDFYNDVVATHGFADEAAAIQSAWRDGDRAGATAAVTPELLDAVGIAGSPAHARERLRSIHARDEIDATLHSFPEGASDDIFETTVDALPGALE